MSAFGRFGRVPADWATSSSTLGVIVLVLVLSLIGGWIGSRRPSLGTPAGFVLGAFSSLGVVLGWALLG